MNVNEQSWYEKYISWAQIYNWIILFRVSPHLSYNRRKIWYNSILVLMLNSLTIWPFYMSEYIYTIIFFLVF